MNKLRILAMVMLIAAGLIQTFLVNKYRRLNDETIGVMLEQNKVLKKQSEVIKLLQDRHDKEAKQQTSETLECSVIHAPIAGCPTGYKRESSPRFTERDGSKEYACVSRDQKKEPCVDVLKAGESMTVTLPFIPRQSEVPAHVNPNERKL